MFKLIRKYIIFYFIFNRGITRENIGEYNDAMDYFYLALSLNPFSVKTYIAIARVSSKNKTCLNGIDFLNKASWRFPYKSQIYAIKADLYRKLKDYDNAIKEYDYAIKWNGDNWEYYEQRAKIKALNGDLKGALMDLNGAICFNSKNHKLFAQRGFYNLLLYNYTDAKKDYNKALTLSPNKHHYSFMIESIKTLMMNTVEKETRYIQVQT